MISLNQVYLKFGDKVIFNRTSFLINSNDRIGLIGNNGAGKSSLLKIILNEQSIEKGSVEIPKNLTFGYLPQQMKIIDKRNLYEETIQAFSQLLNLEKKLNKLNEQLAIRTDYESKDYPEILDKIDDFNKQIEILGGLNIKERIEKTLIGLGFTNEDFYKPTNEFSGGWRMRIELAKIILQHPDVLLLDEPTNHLDIESIQWLENFLSNYKGAVMLISHDRTFLDAVTTRTIEISLGKIYDYNVPYSKYIKIRQEIREHQLAAYKNQQKYIQDTKKFIERFRYKATKAVQVQSRIKQLEKLDIIEIDEEDTSAININFPPAPRSGSIVFELENISKSYNNNQVLNKIDLSVERNEKIAFIGKNGEGKTTLVKILINEIPFEGTYKKGHNLKIGYFAQNQDELLNENITVFDTIDNVAVGDIRSKIRTILGAFLFSGDDIDKKVKVLSGGERSRLALIKLLLEPYNLLILDEPTNHLDMRSKDILKHALLNFNGTLIVVSHDRDFIDGLVNKIYEFKNKKIKECTGNIYNLLKKQKGTLTIDNKEKPENHEDNKDIVSQKDIYLQNKEIDRDIKKAENQIHKCEKNIEIIEKELEILNEKLSNPETSGVNFEDYFKYEKYRELENKLKEEINEWEKLNITLEKHKAKKNN